MGSQEGSSQSPDDRDSVINALDLLDGEKQNILSEILKCAVCLEVPKGKIVLICEKGHHFCSRCHTKLKVCAICRGALLQGRNFVVEELVSKLGPILGVSKPESLPPQKPAQYPSGSFECPHKCGVNVPAFRMVSHMRNKHSQSLIDNVRTNPYTGQYCRVFEVTFSPNQEYLLSVQISDIGFVTVFVCFRNLNLFSFVKILGEKTESNLINYSLLVTAIPEGKPSFQCSMSDCPVATYDQSLESVASDMLLKISEEELLRFLTVGSKITVNFSISRESQRSKVKNNSGCLLTPNKPLEFNNDRKTRRNRARNLRRQKLKKRIESGEYEMETQFSRLSIVL